MKLGQKTTDTYTGQKVTPISVFVVSRDGLNRRICAQPHGINSETGLPLDLIWLTDERLKDGPVEDPVPAHLIGETAEDTLTGFKGVITTVIAHHSGCTHVELTPKERLKNGQPIDIVNVDLLRLKGKNIPKHTEAERQQISKEKPSPVACGRPRH